MSSGETYSVIRIYFWGQTNLAEPSKSETVEFVQLMGAESEYFFDYKGDNTYITKPQMNDEAHEGSYRSIIFPDSSTIVYTNYSTYSAKTKLTVTLKRVK